MSRRIAAVVFVSALVGGMGGVSASSSEPPAYEAYAVRYATLRSFSVANLVQGADPKRTLDIAMTVWVLRAPRGKTVLVDAGFYRPRYLANDRVADYTRPDKVLGRLGIRPEEVTDIIATHMHWDHVDGLDLFSKAQGLDSTGRVRPLHSRSPQARRRSENSATRIRPGAHEA